MTCGIYKIENTIDNKCYIGQSVNIERRFYNHKYYLKKGEHFNRHLQSAWNKYGSENFKFSVVLICDEESLTYFEQAVSDSKADKYNICIDTVDSCKGVKWTEESKDKLQNTWKSKKKTKEYKERKYNRYLNRLYS